MTEETTPYLFDIERVKEEIMQGKEEGGKKKKSWTTYPSKENSDAHLSLKEMSILYGRHCMRKDNQDPIHQLCHTDGENHDSVPFIPMDSKFASIRKTKPGSIIVPLHDNRAIYITSPANTITVRRGQYIFFFADVAHGGITYKHDPEGNDWHPALNCHLDSIHHPRIAGVVSLLFDPLYYLPEEHYSLVKHQCFRKRLAVDLMKKLAGLSDAFSGLKVSDEDYNELLPLVKETTERVLTQWPSRRKVVATKTKKAVTSKKKKAVKMKVVATKKKKAAKKNVGTTKKKVIK
jgi:hypothetical protein